MIFDYLILPIVSQIFGWEGEGSKVILLISESDKIYGLLLVEVRSTIHV